MKRILIATIVVLSIGAVAGGWWWARASVPPLDGQVALPGLRGPVEVRFDQYAVPTAYATGVDDAWFVAGALHARDRLWQMELYRRVTNGRLSEVLGARTVPIDRRFLSLGLRQAADNEWQRLPPSTRAALERYAEGVNAVAATMVGRFRPIEFQVLGITPAPWTPQDSLAVARLLAWRLAENHQAELVRSALAGKLGLDAARALSGRYPSDAPAIVQGAGAASPAAASADASGGAPPMIAGGKPEPPDGRDEWPAGLEWLAPGAKRGNSNNWVVAGSKTTSGRPILANDPHLQIEFPSVWYEMHLVAAGLDVAGVTVPGVPFIVLGHNQRVAWGMTNTGADVQDLYVERFDVAGKRANWRGEWSPVEVTPVEIPVRGRPIPLRFEVWKTRRGTVFAGATDLDWDEPPAWLSPDDRPSGEQRAFTLRWVANGDLAAPVEALDRAASWDDFTAAVAGFSLSQNFVYADVDGNIGYAMSGRLPVRAGADGSRPADGADGEWTGTIDPATLPRVFNPPSGFIASSNNEIDRGFGPLITRDWAAPFRAARLQQRLSSGGKMDVAAMEALQNDRRSLAADAVLAGAASAIEAGRRAQAPAEAISTLELLAAWDRNVDARPVVTLYEAFEDALWRRAFLDEMGQPLFDKFYEWAGAERPAGIHVILADRESQWWDDIATVEKRETRDEIFLLAAADADERLRNDWRSDTARQWDRVHAATFAHPLGASWPLSWFFSRGPVPVTGDGTTVMRVSWNRLRPFAAWEHPSWRQVFEVGQWDQARVAMPAGQSGHPLSPHYFDQNALWRNGQYRPQPFSRAAVTSATAHTLLFTPN